MDLIYTNAERRDLGVLQDYSFDECFGKKDNTFEIKVQRYNHVCEQDYYVYIEFSEYGGIIDTLETDTKTGVVTYKGRTWHGLLNSFVIEPTAGNAYITFDGEANEVLEDIIDALGLGTLFVVDAVPQANRGDVRISQYNVRYEKAYDCILKMLEENEGKLIMYYLDGQVHIGATLSANFSATQEFDSALVPFKAGQTYNNVNHLICLGKGEAQDRAVIHLFLDDGEEVQPYTTVAQPKQDSEYILDKRNQVFTGLEERTEIYDSPNAEIITNYRPITDLDPQGKKPSNWNSQYTNYYRKVVEDGGTKYSKLAQKKKDEYHLLTSKPTDWDEGDNFKKYYYWDATKDSGYYIWHEDTQTYSKCDQGDEGAQYKTGAFANIKAKDTGTYERLTERPKDWATEYSKYYEDSGSSGKTSAQGISYTTYGSDGTRSHPDGSRLRKQPNDWSWNWGNYYRRVLIQATGKYQYYSIEGEVENKPEKIKKAKIKTAEWESTWTNYYVKANASIRANSKIKKINGKYVSASDAVSNGQIPKVKDKDYPAYTKNTYYIMKQKSYAPDFKKVSGGVFEAYQHQAAPNFSSKTYYRYVVTPNFYSQPVYEKHEDVEQIPVFNKYNCYYAVQDRYARLVEGGIEKLKELCDTSTINIDLELDSNYDVLDEIAVIDDVTGIRTTKPITRKIVKIKKDILSVEYEVD